MLHLSRELATIHCEVPIELELSTCLWQPEAERVRSKMEELEFKNMLQLIS
ncbi:hypothetical protein D3C71_1755840 [compost metagenome]